MNISSSGPFKASILLNYEHIEKNKSVKSFFHTENKRARDSDVPSLHLCGDCLFHQLGVKVFSLSLRVLTQGLLGGRVSCTVDGGWAQIP